jgi:hypothetical protein
LGCPPPDQRDRTAARLPTVEIICAPVQGGLKRAGMPPAGASMSRARYVPNVMGVRILLSVSDGTGVLAGFMDSWWTSGWIWTSLAVLVVIWVAM